MRVLPKKSLPDRPIEVRRRCDRPRSICGGSSLSEAKRSSKGHRHAYQITTNGNSTFKERFQRLSKISQNIHAAEMEQAIQNNKLSIHFKEAAENFSKQCPTFKKLLRMLVTDQAFEFFKMQNQKRGGYQHAIDQLERAYFANYRLKFSETSKVKTHKNLGFSGVDRPKQHSCTTSSTPNRRKTEGQQDFQFKAAKNRANLSIAFRNLEKNDKWKVGDFLNSLMEDQNMSLSMLSRAQSKQQIVSRFSSLHNRCAQLEKNQQVKENIDLFSKYTDQLGQKLHKKRVKLEKMQHWNI